MYSARLEGIAQDVLDASLCGETPPVDAIELAACCGLHVEYSNVRDALLYDDTIYISRRISALQLHIKVAHEIGHFALRRAREENSEASADYLAGALMVPRRSLLVSLRGGWNLDELRALHAHAPATTIAARVAQVREGTAAVYDRGLLARRIGPEHPRELELMRAAMELGVPVRENDLAGAWPVFTGSCRRVIVLAPVAIW